MLGNKNFKGKTQKSYFLVFGPLRGGGDEGRTNKEEDLFLGFQKKDLKKMMTTKLEGRRVRALVPASLR